MTLPASLLIVDDDRELGQMLTEYLTGEGFQVTLLRDGAEALEKLTEQTHPFDLVILDVMLPSLSGFEVLRRLRHSLSVPVMTVPSAPSANVWICLLPTSPTISVFSSSDSRTPFGRLTCFMAALSVPLVEYQ